MAYTVPRNVKRPPTVDPSGLFSWLHLTRGQRSKIDVSDMALLGDFNWSFNHEAYFKDEARGYAVTGNPKRQPAHLLMDIPPGMEVEHINGDTLDNRRCNLRASTRSQNLKNRRLFKNNTSGHAGVRQMPSGKWTATVTLTFDTAGEAIEARKTMEKASHHVWKRGAMPAPLPSAMPSRVKFNKTTPEKMGGLVVQLALHLG